MPNQKMTQWLDKVCAHILRPSYRKMVRKELTAHLNDRIRQLENDGLSHEKAIDQAIKIMGDAEKVGKAFSKCDNLGLFIKKAIINIIIWIIIILLMIYIINKII